MPQGVGPVGFLLAAMSIPVHQPRILHPLMGCNLSTLRQISGRVPLRYWPHLSLAIATAVVRLPVKGAE